MGFLVLVYVFIYRSLIFDNGFGGFDLCCSIKWNGASFSRGRAMNACERIKRVWNIIGSSCTCGGRDSICLTG